MTMMFNAPSLLFSFLLGSVLCLSCGQTNKTLYDLLVDGSDKYQGVIRALNSTEPNLLEQLSNERRSFTIFVPNDDVYKDKITEDLRNKLLSEDWSEHRQQWIRLHVLGFPWPTADWGTRPGVVSMSGLVLNLTATTVNGLSPVLSDIEAVNGYMHEIPSVFTHRFLSRTVWEAASVVPGFSTVSRLTEQVGLIDLAQGTGPNTIFVPTDSAFAELEEKINLDDAPLVKQIFEYHVIPGTNVYAQNVMTGDALVTLQGESLTITALGVNSAGIGTSNVVLSNGVVHTIGEVLIPPSIQAKIVDGSLTKDSPPTSAASSWTLLSTIVTMSTAITVCITCMCIVY